ncbi:PorV/PorQ family protein [Elusimicrobiota bacterium]
MRQRKPLTRASLALSLKGRGSKIGGKCGIQAAALLLLALPAFASFSGDDKGTATAQFLKLGVGARAVAMGEAYSALADDATALYWNPAALNNLSKRSATFMHAAYIESSFFDYLAYSQPLNDKSAIGAGIQYLSVGSITETDETGSNVGSYNPSDMALTAGYARKIGDFSLGMNAKFIQSKIINSASAFAFDLGVLSPVYMNEKARFAFTVTNLGTKMKFDEAKEDLPLALRIGSSYRISDAWVSGLDIGLSKDNEPYVALGTEYLMPAGNNWTFAGRVGLNTRTMSDIGGLSGISLGFGVIRSSFGFDYAFLPMGDLGTTHRISINFKF